MVGRVRPRRRRAARLRAQRGLRAGGRRRRARRPSASWGARVATARWPRPSCGCATGGRRGLPTAENEVGEAIASRFLKSPAAAPASSRLEETARLTEIDQGAARRRPRGAPGRAPRDALPRRHLAARCASCPCPSAFTCSACCPRPGPAPSCPSSTTRRCLELVRALDEHEVSRILDQMPSDHVVEVVEELPEGAGRQDPRPHGGGEVRGGPGAPRVSRRTPPAASCRTTSWPCTRSPPWPRPSSTSARRRPATTRSTSTWWTTTITWSASSRCTSC